MVPMKIVIEYEKLGIILPPRTPRYVELWAMTGAALTLLGEEGWSWILSDASNAGNTPYIQIDKGTVTKHFSAENHHEAVLMAFKCVEGKP